MKSPVHRRSTCLLQLAAVYVACMAHMLVAHPSDISYLKATLEKHRLELRFTFNLLSISRFCVVDANQDRRIDKAELTAAAPALSAYFEKHVEININEVKAMLGSLSPLECVWPVVDGSDSVAEQDYPLRYVDITFTQALKPVLADVWLGFDIWQQTGPLGTVEATFEQGDLRMQVPFSMSEPDYLYDTGFAVEDIFKEQPVQKKNSAWTLCVAAFSALSLATLLLRHHRAKRHSST